ncbi:MAG TPA: hypothetical protein VIC28_14585 [Thermoanaerobaculia bacterium]|jgi:hypothetical protein
MARNPFVRRTWGLGICLLALLCALPLAAQVEPAPEAGGGGPAAEPQQASAASPLPGARSLRVIAVRSLGHPKRTRLGDGISVKLSGMQLSSLEQVKKGCAGLILFLNDIPIKGVPPDSCSLGRGEIRFTLDRTDESDKAWHSLLEEPIAFSKPVTVSVGPDGDLAFPTDADPIQLEVLPEAQFWTYCAGLALFVVVLFWLARRTPLLRDRSPLTPAGKLPPYSLSRFQMAFWSFLIIAAYVFIWMITQELDTITGSVLALLGIGSSTALAATLIDKEKVTKTAAGEGEAQAPSAAAPPAKTAAVSEGFLRDVLSDDEGISLYRLQLFVWTIVLGIIFIASVYDGLQMPQFNPTLLGLMGISSGTYLGFKVPESRTPPRVE